MTKYLIFLLVLWSVNASAVATGTGLAATYYNQNGTAGAYFTGSSYSRIDPQVNFNWSSASPWTPNIGADNFTVRWTGEIEFPVAGNYKFRTNSDDGIRLTVNGLVLIDEWNDHSATLDTSGNTSFAAGRYPIVLEYYEHGGDAVAQLYWSDTGSSSFTLVPQKYLYPGMTTKALYAESVCGTQNQVDLLFDQDLDATTANQAANYQLDNGVSVISAQLLPLARRVRLTTSTWTNKQAYQLSFSGLKAADGSNIAPNSLSFSTNYGLLASGLRGTYFSQNAVARAYFSGTQIERIDPTLNFDWSTGIPISGIGADYFSVRWTGLITPATSGSYQLYTNSDDGIRAYLDEIPIIGDFSDHSANEVSSGALSLVAGNKYKLTVEFYEHTGYAVSQLLWSGPSISKTAVPNSALAYCAYQNPVSTVNHYKISHAGSGVNCAPSQISISAHDVNHLLFKPAAGTKLQLSARNTATSGLVGTWSNPSWGSLTAAGTGIATVSFDGLHDSVTLDYSYNQAATLNFDLSDGASSELTGSASADLPVDANLVLAASGFRFVDATGAAALPSQIAARPSSVPIFVQAVRTDTNTSSCLNLFPSGATVVVNMASQCTNPASCLLNNQVSFSNNSNSYTLTHPQQGGATSTPVSLKFAASGMAQLDNLSYPEAGQISLNISYSLSGLTLVGTSSAFSVRPAGFCIDSGSSCSSPYDSCPVLAAAGSAFSTQIRAVAWQSDSDTNWCVGNAVTQNFELASLSLSHSLLAPSPGSLGVLTNATTSLVHGLATIAPSLSEVGVFQFNTSPVAYFDTSIPASQSAPVGRIRAHHLQLQNLSLLPGCSSFSYAGLVGTKAGQPFSLSLNLLPQNAQNAVLQNYQGLYARMGTAASYVTATPTPALGQFDLSAQAIDNYNPVSLTWVKGLSYQMDSARAPLTLSLGLNLTDTDGATGAISSPGEGYRLGRLLALEAFGPEDKNLALSLRTEYFDGSRYQPNSLDYCTSLNLASTSLDSFVGLSSTDTSVRLSPTGFSGSCRVNAGQLSPMAAATATSTDQQCYMSLMAPGIGRTGSLRYTSPEPAWLVNANSHRAPATFGRYRGSDRVLLWQEFH